MKHQITFIALAGLSLSASCARNHDETAGFVVQPYVQNPGATSMTIMWISSGIARSTVRYGIGGTTDKAAAISLPKHQIQAEPPEYVYEAKLTELEQDRDYSYEVCMAGKTAGGRFRTLPENPAGWSFILYGDSRSNPEIHASLARRFEAHGPAFILHSGDMVETGAYEEWKEQYFEPLKGVISNIAVWPALGNHEGNGGVYRMVYSLPGNERWYSFDCGNAHFTVVNSEGSGGEMLRWCAEDLAGSKATWKIVMYHKPSYDHGWRGTAWGRKSLLPVMRKHGVDLVLCGHAHGYVRLKPMFTRGENDERPITHITSAGGGAPINDRLLPGIPHMAAQSREYHYMVFTIQGERLDAEALSVKGEVLDKFAIEKKNGRYAPDYLKIAKDESSFGKDAARVEAGQGQDEY